jgi:hypothetical protein
MGKYGRKPYGAAAVSAVPTRNELSMQAQRNRPDHTSSTVWTPDNRFKCQWTNCTSHRADTSLVLLSLWAGPHTWLSYQATHVIVQDLMVNAIFASANQSHINWQYPLKKNLNGWTVLMTITAHVKFTKALHKHTLPLSEQMWLVAGIQHRENGLQPPIKWIYCHT